METSYYSEGEGYNSRLDEVQAEILRGKLLRLDTYIARRRDLAALYDELLVGGQVSPIAVAAPEEHCYYVYAVRHPKRDEIVAKLREHDILVNISYPWPIHTMRGFDNLGYTEGDLPATEAHARSVFSLPIYPKLNAESVRRVCEVLAQLTQAGV